MSAPEWHASPALLSAYAAGSAGPVDAASAEAHLASCAMCRAELTLALTPLDRTLLGDVYARVAPTAATSRPAPRTRAATVPWARLVLRPDAILAVVAAVALAFGLDVLLSQGGGDAGPGSDVGGGLLRLLAPVIPLAGVALCAVRAGDPCREAVLATSSSGLRLTLWRTATVLALAVPATLVLELALTSSTGPVTWLLPGLTLCVTSLALGTVVDLPRAAGGVGVLWLVLTIGPPLARSASDPLRALVEVASGSSSTLLLAGGTVQLGWLTLAVLAALVLALRRAHYARLAGPGPWAAA